MANIYIISTLNIPLVNANIVTPDKFRIYVRNIEDILNDTVLQFRLEFLCSLVKCPIVWSTSEDLLLGWDEEFLTKNMVPKILVKYPIDRIINISIDFVEMLQGYDLLIPLDAAIINKIRYDIYHIIDSHKNRFNF